MLKNNLKTLLIILLLANAAVTAVAETSEITRVTNWKVSGANITGQDLSAFPLTVTAAKPRSGADTVNLTGEFTLPPPHERSGALGIFIYKNLLSCVVYVNDVPLATIGRRGEDFFFQPYITRSILVPEVLLKEKNTIRFEMWNDTGTYKLRMLDFTDEATFQKLTGVFSFLDIQLPRFATCMLLFIAVYSTFLFLNNRKKHELLYLAAGAGLFSIYLLNVTIADAGINYLTLKAFLYSCFPLSMFFLFHFFKIYFNVRTGRKTFIATGAVALFFAVGYYFMGNTKTLDTWHSVMLVLPVSTILFATYGFFRSIRSAGIKNLPIGVGLFVAVCFSAYDMYYFILDLTPFILLQGIGYMGLILGTFYSFSQSLSNANKQCEIMATQLEDSRIKRELVFEHIKQAVIKNEETSKSLDKSIESVSTLIEQYIASISNVNSNIEIQHEQVQSNKTNVESIFTAIKQTSDMVAKHEGLVEVTVDNINDLTGGIHETNELVQKTAAAIRKLTEVCSTADRDVETSSRFVDDLASYSKNINEIASSIQNISEQTNVLSINAAIEAARSGPAGKGFSVVAGEIRSLASKSGDNANKINEILKTMVEKILVIQNQEQLVSKHLKEIIAENINTNESIESIFTVLSRQLEKNSLISETVQDLIDTVHTIAAQTANQKSSGENLRQSLSLLEVVTDAILTASREQQACNEELTVNLKKIQAVSITNLEVIRGLKTLTR